jgi:hypothetical protein
MLSLAHKIVCTDWPSHASARGSILHRGGWSSQIPFLLIITPSRKPMMIPCLCPACELGRSESSTEMVSYDLLLLLAQSPSKEAVGLSLHQSFRIPYHWSRQSQCDQTYPREHDGRTKSNNIVPGKESNNRAKSQLQLKDLGLLHSVFPAKVSAEAAQREHILPSNHQLQKWGTDCPSSAANFVLARCPGH